MHRVFPVSEKTPVSPNMVTTSLFYSKLLFLQLKCGALYFLEYLAMYSHVIKKVQVIIGLIKREN